MSRIAYVNGAYMPLANAAIHIEDRGFQFADGIYEGIEIWRSNMVDLTRHLNRLERSLSELSIEMPMSRAALTHILRETTRRNHVSNGFMYIQITRGQAKRDHAFPKNAIPTIVVTVKKSDPVKIEGIAAKGVAVITTADNRWERVDIKSTGLLPNVLAKQKAREAGAYEAWFVDKAGYITEGSSTNAWIITKDSILVTRPAEQGILRGVTRTTLFEVAKALNLRIEERAFSLQEAYEAKEAFITAATNIVMPVVQLNGKSIGNGHIGEISAKLRQKFHDISENIK